MMRPKRLYHGWLVVGAAFVVALFGWGIGFYGPGIYLMALQERHGFRFPLPQILPRRMDRPLAQAGGDLITDDFAPADVYDVMGDRARRKK